MNSSQRKILANRLPLILSVRFIANSIGTRRFETLFHFENIGPSKRIICTAIAHHRFNYIHPFPDGNGRVSRLMSHAMFLLAGVGAHGLWSISPGLARGLQAPSEYKARMARADDPREGELDGRGNLSQTALREFVVWFLNIALDQVVFMTELFELEGLAQRLSDYVSRQTQLRPEASRLLQQTLQLPFWQGQ
ncbi:MAG: Fic family protein [Myxococcales bacterium]|nr:MAG: Fic family protein [Myxococcales bacterium]